MSSLNTDARASQTTEAGLRERLRAVWSSGDFARVGARLVLVGELLCRSVEVHAGEHVLDVAAGSGNAAIAAACREASVTASDFVEPLLEVARARAELDGLQLATAVADAQELPFDDGSFDVVLSTFGAMFAPDQQRTADELLRVCRPGGRIGLANWVPDGLMARQDTCSGPRRKSSQAPVRSSTLHRRGQPAFQHRDANQPRAGARLTRPP